jgi:hypothetical protein
VLAAAASRSPREILSRPPFCFWLRRGEEEENDRPKEFSQSPLIWSTDRLCRSLFSHYKFFGVLKVVVVSESSTCDVTFSRSRVVFSPKKWKSRTKWIISFGVVLSTSEFRILSLKLLVCMCVLLESPGVFLLLLWANRFFLKEKRKTLFPGVDFSWKVYECRHWIRPSGKLLKSFQTKPVFYKTSLFWKNSSARYNIKLLCRLEQSWQSCRRRWPLSFVFVSDARMSEPHGVWHVLLPPTMDALSAGWRNR